MSDETTQVLRDLSTTLVSVQHTMDRLETTMTSNNREVSSATSDLRRDVVASVDRLERSFSSLDARLEAGEAARREQYDFIKSQLKRAQDERQDAVAVVREDNRDEIQRQRTITDDNREKAIAGLRALWDMGGKYIVYAVAAYILAKLAGIQLNIANLTGG